MNGARINLRDSKRIRAFLDDLDPATRGSVSDQALESIARLTEQRAKEVEIVRGRGRNTETSPPLPKQLSFRSGRLSGSISTDTSQRPKQFVVGSTVVYAPVHELGLSVSVPAHNRTNADGKRYRVKAHKAKFPKRPFLEPAATHVISTQAEKVFRKALQRARGKA